MKRLYLWIWKKKLVKPRNIFLKLKEHNEKNVTTIKQVYNSMNVYWRSERGHKIEMQLLMMLLEWAMYVYCCKFDEVSNDVQDIFWTHLIHWNYWISLTLYYWWIIPTKLTGIRCLYLRLLVLHQWGWPSLLHLFY